MTIRLFDLPEDMQVLIEQFYEFEDEVDWWAWWQDLALKPFTIIEVPVYSCRTIPNGDSDRNPILPSHDVPPILLVSNGIIDGIHRILGARIAGAETIQAIDLCEHLPMPKYDEPFAFLNPA